MSTFRVEVYSKKHDLKRIVAVINAAYTKHWYLQRERINLKELKDLLANPQNRLYLCLSSENEICGTVLLDFSHLGQADLFLFSIDPSYQKQNLGKFLLDSAEKEAFEKYHVERIVLDVVKFLEKLISYYSLRGYQPTGEMEFPDKDWVKPEFREQIRCLLMEKKRPS